jgi:hypothetical protein
VNILKMEALKGLRFMPVAMLIGEGIMDEEGNREGPWEEYYVDGSLRAKGIISEVTGKQANGFIIMKTVCLNKKALMMKKEDLLVNGFGITIMGNCGEKNSLSMVYRMDW